MSEFQSLRRWGCRFKVRRGHTSKVQGELTAELRELSAQPVQCWPVLAGVCLILNDPQHVLNL